MSFSAEISDFVKGFSAGAAIGGDIQDRKMKREEYEFEKAFKEKSYAEQSARANRALDLRERGIKETSADRAANRAERERARAATIAERAKDRAERTEARRANELLGGAQESTKEDTAPADDWYDFDEAFPETEAIDTGDDSADDATEGYAKGGLVQHAANGAPVQAIPTEEDEEVTEDPTINREGKGDPLFSEAAKVTRDVMDEWVGDAGEKPAAVDTNPKKSQARIASVQPASPEEIKAIDSKIDPDNTMEPYRKGAARLVNAYNFFVEKGDVNKARKIAAQILKFDQMATMTLGNLAQTAIEQGNLRGASKLVSDAYNNHIPDGGKMEAQATPRGTIAYKIDAAESGRQQGEISAQQLWQLAGGIANGSEFIKSMEVLAGRAPATSESNDGAPAGKGKKRSYTQTVAEAAEAMNRFEDLSSAYAEATAEEKKKLYADLKASREAADKAYATAVRGAKATKRKPGDLQKDLSAARKNAMGALPEDPNAPASEEESGGSWWGAGLSKSWSDRGYGPKAEAVPSQPDVEDQKTVGGKTYVKIGGKWFEQN